MGTTRLGQINSTTRPAAHRVVDGDTWHVELDLDGVADTLLDQIAQTLHRERRMGQIMLLGNPRVSPADKATIRSQLKAALILNRAFDVPLFTEQAEGLQNELWASTFEPDRCEGPCGGDNFATVGNLCGDCDEANSAGNAQAGGRL